LGPLGFHPAFSKAVIAGLFEVTLGAQAASDVPASVSLLWKTAVATAIVSWGGLSVHAQVASILSSTDIRFAPFLFARMLHACLAVILTFLLWKPLTAISLGFVRTVPVFLVTDQGAPLISWWQILAESSSWAISLLALLVLASLLLRQILRKSSRFS
ncbi:hypothetical protein MXD63_37505, partial [Frankia sp. Cpl3]|nr:hypothetical protein [Frankia sp. Cpl3]